MLRLVGEPSPGPALRLLGDRAPAGHAEPGDTGAERTPDGDEAPFGWYALARCRGMGAEIFFGTVAEQIEAAKAVCRRCQVQLRCLDEAMRNPALRGVWGGASDRDRQTLRRRRSRATRYPSTP